MKDNLLLCCQWGLAFFLLSSSTGWLAGWVMWIINSSVSIEIIWKSSLISIRPRQEAGRLAAKQLSNKLLFSSPFSTPSPHNINPFVILFITTHNAPGSFTSFWTTFYAFFLLENFLNSKVDWLTCVCFMINYLIK